MFQTCFQVALSFRVLGAVLGKTHLNNLPLALLLILIMKPRSNHMPYGIRIWFTVVPFYKVCRRSWGPSECARRIQLSTNPGEFYPTTVNKKECCWCGYTMSCNEIIWFFWITSLIYDCLWCNPDGYAWNPTGTNSLAWRQIPATGSGIIVFINCIVQVKGKLSIHHYKCHQFQ